MPRRLPPLNALKAFEAAARHLSFTKAAEELFVTQAAVSHQIKGLEEVLGIALFRRLNRALMLTEEGQALFPALRGALDQIAGALEQIQARGASGVITVSTMDSFAVNWLVPRLNRFRHLHPEIDVHISSSDHLVDFVTEGVDVALRYGRGQWPGVTAERLMTEELFPVCSPSLLENGPPLGKPSDLLHHTLLHDDMRVDWRMWHMAAGISVENANRGPSFTHSNNVMQAAIAGLGVALGRSVLVADHLVQGRLIKPFDISLPADFAYYLAYPEAALKRPKVKAFRDWIMEEVARG